MQRTLMFRQAAVSLVIAVALSFVGWIYWGRVEEAGGALWFVTLFGLLGTVLVWFRLGYLARREGFLASWLPVLLCFVPYALATLANLAWLTALSDPDTPAWLLVAWDFSWMFLCSFTTGISWMVDESYGVLFAFLPLAMFVLPMVLGGLAFRRGRAESNPMD